MGMQTIYDYDLKQLEEVVGRFGQKPYRAKQIFTWLYRKRVLSFEEMTDLPSAFIEQLKENFVIMPLKEVMRQTAKDGTIKFLFEMMDGSSVESVLMHFAYGESLCVSSQIGCNMGCTFCASGLLKKQRDLTSGEMVGEVMYVQKMLDEMGKRVDNILGECRCVLVNSRRRIATGLLNEVLQEAIRTSEPPSRKGNRLKIYYITETSVAPPTFVLKVNDPELMHFSYQRYIENALRRAFDFEGTPIRIVVRHNKEED